MKKKYPPYIILALLVICAYACGDLQDVKDASLDTSDVSIAIPLINTKISIGTVSDRLEGNTSIKIDSEGRPTIIYSGDIVRRDATAIFPVVPAGIIDIPIEGNGDTWSLEELEALTDAFKDNIIRKAIWQDNFLFFKLQHEEESDVEFTITIPEFTLDGEAFTRSFVVPPRFNEFDIHETAKQPLDGYLFTPVDNSVTFLYTATNTDGEEVEMTFSALNLDFLNFSYVEGYFGSRLFDIEGDAISIGLFNKWLSGGLEFEDPRLKIKVENAFGFPVKTDFKELQISTITGLEYDIESIIIDEGIDFLFPSLEEVGEVKITEFDFNRDNSNIEQIFTDKVSEVSYDIDAITNADEDTTFSGFLIKDSYFLINVAVDLPLKGIIKELVVTDTVDLSITNYDEVESGELKFVMRNEFPADVRVHGIVLDENDVVKDILFDNEGLNLPAAPLGSDGRTLEADPVIHYLDISAQRYDAISQGSKIALIAYIDSENISSDFLWIYDDYEVDFRLGAILNLAQ